MLVPMWCLLGETAEKNHVLQKHFFSATLVSEIVANKVCIVLC